jgi:hypothetical protein
MKKAFAVACAVCMAIILSLMTTALGAGTGSYAAVAVSDSFTELLPVEVLNNPDSLEIRKIYELDPGVDPGTLPRDGFERSGYAYECSDILREVVIGEEAIIVAVTETAESKKNDMDTVLDMLPQYKEYINEDGFTGTLLLNTATIKSEVSGYYSTNTPYTVSRSYPNLSDADTQFIPKTIDDSGKTLQLQDIEWQIDNTYNVDDYEIGNRYTAIAIYSGTKTSSYVKGYTITAAYSGEAIRKGVKAIRYTVIFTGLELPAPEPTAEPTTPATEKSEPEPEELIVAELERANNSDGLIWLPIIISTLALLGCGACIHFTIKNRKETSHFEKTHDYSYTDSYTDDIGGDASAGDGER